MLFKVPWKNRENTGNSYSIPWVLDKFREIVGGRVISGNICGSGISKSQEVFNNMRKLTWVNRNQAARIHCRPAPHSFIRYLPCPDKTCYPTAAVRIRIDRSIYTTTKSFAYYAYKMILTGHLRGIRPVKSFGSQKLSRICCNIEVLVNYDPYCKCGIARFVRKWDIDLL